MSALPLQFAVRVGIPGSLTIEVQAVPSISSAAIPNILAPLNQPVLVQDTGNTATASTSRIALAKALMSQAWGQGWANTVSQRLAALGGNSDYQLLTFECPSLDTTDMAWGAQGSIDGVTDPIQVTAPLFGTSVYGRQFAVGDYVLWNDAALVNGVYQYEIDQITAVRGSSFTLQRGSRGSIGGAKFGSVKAPHSNIQFLQLIDKTFDVLWAGEWQVYKFLWDNMIVSAVSATTIGL
jgi:hypothetical protein